LSVESYIVLHSFKEEHINEIMNSVNNNLFSMAVLERRINLQQDAKKEMHSLKDYLSYYLGRLASLYSAIKDNLREYDHDSFINVHRKAFTLFKNELVIMEESQLNGCVLESSKLM
ncbi:hypothetical protein C922_05718, partial [Plasmodium inui San Antonio 1]